MFPPWHALALRRAEYQDGDDHWPDGAAAHERRLHRVLGEIIATQTPRREIHVIVDNLSAHKTKAVEAFLAAHPRVHLHFTPMDASWLNQVELWFNKIERDLVARGIFTSLPDLARKIRRHIKRYNDNPKPIRWTYNNPTHPITTDSADTVH